LGHIFDLVRAINQARDDQVSDAGLKPARDLIRELVGVFGLQLDRPKIEAAEATPYIDLLVEVRDELRKQKLWALSDRIRDQLGDLGVIVEDVRDDSTWRWK
jgi:cysteinyl-tRNA synthetase